MEKLTLIVYVVAVLPAGHSANVPPSAPNVTVDAVTATTITISWSQDPTDTIDATVVVSDYIGPCTGFMELSGINFLDGSTINYVLSNLSQDSLYLLRVAVQNRAVGFSSFSEVNVLTGIAGPPTVSPITFGVRDTTSVQFLWTSSNASITAFSITWDYIGPCPEGLASGGSTLLSGSAREYTVTNLLPGSRYNMTIVAFNEFGSAEEQAVLKTLPAGPSLDPPPSNVTVDNVTTTSITISWEPISCLQTMYASILVVITDTVLDAEIANVTVTDTGQYTVDGLRSGATYSFELFVALEDLQLYGQNSSSVIGVTLLAPPSDPNVTVDAITDTTIAISWSQGPTDNINDYVVVYHYTGTCTGLGFRRFFLDGSARNHVQHDLRPGSRYLVVVAARNGAGIESSEMNVSTAFAMPSLDPPPGGLQILNVSQTYISLSWDPVPCLQRHGQPVNVTVTINGSGFQLEDTVADTGGYTHEGLEPGTVYTIDVSVAFGGMIGTNSSRTQANTLGPPTAPLITVGVQGTTSVQFLWTSSNVVSITAFYITWDYIGPCSEALAPGSSTLLSGSAREYTVTDLPPSSRYNLTIVAINDLGSAEGQAELTTLGGFSLDPPSNVSVDNVTGTSITISWEPISCLQRNSASTSILVVITDIMLGAKLANVTVNDTGQYTVDGLRSGVAYSFELFVALEDLQLYSQNSSSTIGVTLLVPPSVPNVTVDAVAATTITISWSQDPTDTIDHSVVMYDYMGPCFGRGVISELFSLGSSTRNHVIADLRPNSQYLVIVDTQNAAGSSASEVNVSTASAAPSLDPPPRGLQILNASQTNISLSWDPVPCLQRHGQPVNVTVAINGSDFQSEDTVADTGSYTQEGLEPGTVYTIDVSVAFGGMIGTNSSRIQANTLGLPTAPLITVGVQGTTSVQFLWTSSNVVSITTFSITWDYIGPCPEGLAPGGSTLLSGSASEYTVTDLLPGSRYNMTIVAINDLGSAEGQAVLTTLGDFSLDPPFNVSVDNVTGTSITISWEPISCLQRNSTSTSILVVITDIMLGAEISNVTLNDTGQYTVYGLRSGVAYTFELFVALEDLQLYSQNSSSVIGVTLLVPPSVPNVTVDAVTATTITISWSQDPTDTIDHSVVMYDYMGPCFGRGVISDLFSLSSSTRNHVIADLRPNSQYLVIVDTQNAAGSSASEVNVSTASAAPSLDPPPGDLQILNASQTHISLSWDPVPCLQRHGQPVNITVTINGSGFQSEDTVADTGSYTQEGLEPGTVYTIDVFVAFGGMIGTNSSRIQANTLGLPTAPLITVGVQGTTSVQFLWTFSNVVSITTFYITWDYIGPCPEALAPGGSTLLSGSAREYTVTNLPPGSRYNLTIVAINDLGSAEGQTVLTTLGGFSLDPPSNVSVDNVTGTSITISWEPISCLQRNSASTSLLVVITDIMLGAEIANVTLNDTGQYTVYGLRSGVEYSFELFVALEDLQLYGQNGSSVIGATLLVPPSVPNVTVDAVTATTITISWSQDPTDTIDHSVVVYDYMGPCFGRGVISELFSLSSSTRNHVIADLRPNSQYLVIIDTQNAAGSSASEVNVFTASAAPSLDPPPGDLQILNVSQTHISLSWDPVPCLQRHGQPVNVTVTINGSGFQSENTVADTGSYTQEGLEPGTVYTIDVSVAFGGMIGTNFSRIQANTLGPPTAPLITVGVQGTTSAQFLWTSSNASITAFSITWDYIGPCPEGLAPGGFPLLSGSAREYTVTDLLPGSRYNMTIVAINDLGSAEGRAVLETLFAAPDVDTPPSNLRMLLSATSDTSLGISWDPISCIRRHNITIAIRIKIAILPSQALVADLVLPDTGVYVREGLQPAITYKFTLFAQYQSEVGDTGAVITATTLPQVVNPLYCEEDLDEQWSLTWVRTVGGLTVFLPCSMEDTTGFAFRKCFLNGTWNATVDTSGCQRKEIQALADQVLSLMLDDADSTATSEQVVEVISSLTVVTSPGETLNTSLFPQDLNTTTMVVGLVLDFIVEQVDTAETGELLPFYDELIVVFDNLLEDSNQEGWEQLQMVSHEPTGSQVLLQQVEDFAAYVGDAIVNDKVDTGNKTEILLERDNIVLDAVAIPSDERYINTVYFPDLGGPETMELGNAEVQLQIPANLLVERGAKDANLTAVNVKFSNLEMFLPSLGNATRVISSIVSSQILSTSGDSDKGISTESPVMFYIETAKFNASHTILENARCGFIQNARSSEDLWSVAGVETIEATLIEEEEIYYMLLCQSFHLTSFAALVDVHGIAETIPEAEQYALTVVTYIGCAISIVFLTLSVAALGSLGKELFASVQNFVHLNLALSLLLGYVVFVAGVDTAVTARAACVVVAALLHYLFTAVFCWMLCEGIMLYLMLVLVFSTLSKKWWFFFLLGWGCPIIPVVLSVSVMPEQYGTDEYCWLSVNDPSSSLIWLFVAPMLVVIVINAFALLAALRSFYKVKKEKMQDTGAAARSQLFGKVLLAAVVLLPLVGLTWVFGLLAVNNNLTVFTWIFTILNSLQGLFLFIFHVLRNDKVMSRLKALLYRRKNSPNTASTSIKDVRRREELVSKHSKVSKSSSNLMRSPYARQDREMSALVSDDGTQILY